MVDEVYRSRANGVLAAMRMMQREKLKVSEIYRGVLRAATVQGVWPVRPGREDGMDCMRK